MPYTPQTWVDDDDDYPLSAARMTNLEQGVQAAAAAAEAGIPGPQGLVWRKEWDTQVSYGIDDGVRYGGRAWIALQPSTGVAPPTTNVPTATWDLLADKGDGGTGGTGGGGVLSPADLALKAWTCDPAIVQPGVRYEAQAGRMIGSLMRVPADTLTRMSLFVGVPGAGVTNAYCGLVDATTGNRVATSANIATDLQGGGMKRIPFTAPVNYAGGLVYAVLVVGGFTTAPQVTKLPNTDTDLLNLRGPTQPGGRVRSGRLTTADGLTSIPATNDLSGSEQQNTGLWTVID